MTLTKSLNLLEKIQKENPKESVNFVVEYMNCELGKWRAHHVYDQEDFVGWGDTIESAIINYANACKLLTKTK